MDDLLDMIISDESPTNVSDKIKEILYTKSAEKIEAIRPGVNNSMFDEEEFKDAED